MSIDYMVFAGSGVLNTTERHTQINLSQGATSLVSQDYNSDSAFKITLDASQVNLLVGAADEDVSGVFSFTNTVLSDGSEGIDDEISISIGALRTAVTLASQIVLGTGSVAQSWMRFHQSIKALFANPATDDSLFDDEMFTSNEAVIAGTHLLTATKWLATLNDDTAGDEPLSTLRIQNLLSLFQDAVERNIVDAAAGGIGASGLSTVDASGREVSDRFLPGDVIYFANGISMTVKLPIETVDSTRLSGSFAVVTDPGESLDISGSVTLPVMISKTYTSDLFIFLS